MPFTRPKITAKWYRWAWLTIAILAVASRLIGLASTPLAPDEAARAMHAWDAVQSGAWPLSSDGPLLLVGQALLFTLLNPSGWTARLLPALAGIGLIGLPFFWRREIGDLGALVAAALLLISPLSLFAAHRSHPAALAILGSALIASALWVQHAEADGGGEGRRAAGLALGLALGITGGAAFYDAIFAAGFTALALHCIGRRSRPATDLPWQRAAVIGVIAALVIAVAGGWHWAGWAGILDGAAAWLHEWQTAAERSLAPLSLLLLYEPALVIATIAGLGLLVANPDSHRMRSPWALALGAATAALVIAIRPGSSPEGLSLVIVPLALFGGWATDRLWRDLTRPLLQWTAYHSIVSALFWVPGLLALAQNARGILGTDQLGLILAGLIVLIALQVLLVFIFLMYLPPNIVWRGALTGLILIFLFIQISFAMGLGFVRADQAVEPAIHTAGSRNMAHLTDLADEIAIEREMRRDSLPIVLLDHGETWIPTLRWVLRDFSNIQRQPDWPQDTDALVLTSADSDLPTAGTSTFWEGMRFVAATTHTFPPPPCRLLPLVCADALRWYLYREPAEPASPIHVILWKATGTGN
jgi:hypothetical protein